MKKIVLSVFLSGLLFLPAQLNLINLNSAVVYAEESVIYNVKTHKYHKSYCSSAVRCTANCITISKSQAVKKGGIPCKKCGG